MKRTCKILKCTSLALAASVAIGLTGHVCAGIPAAQALSQRLLVIVNDQPITDYDVNQRVKLNDTLGYSRGSKIQRRKDALQDLIDEVIKIAEAKKFKVEVKPKQIDGAIEGLAKGSNLTVPQLQQRLKSKGVGMPALRRQVEATLLFRWMMRGRYKINITVEDAEVDRRYAQFLTDPRLKPISVYQLQEIILPVEQVSEAMRNQLFYARAIEARQIIQRYKGCRSVRQAASGIFNVKIGKVVKAPADRMPKEMRQVLDQSRPGKLLGPMRASNGVRLIGYCGRGQIKPPKPPKEYVKNLLLNEKFKRASDRIMRELRRKAYIDYKVRGAALTQ